METEVIDKLFLELSQVTKAKTGRELALERTLISVLGAWKRDGISNAYGNMLLYDRSLAILGFGKDASGV